jgi:hypothetical protein
MNVWVPVREEVSVVIGLATQGWAVRAGELYRLSSPPAVPRTALVRLTYRQRTGGERSQARKHGGKFLSR